MSLNSTNTSIDGGVRQTLSLKEIAAKTPAAYFGMVLGLAGLGNGWRAASRLWGSPTWISEGVLAVAAVAWAILLFLYLTKLLIARDQVIAEANHPVQCCFIGLIGVATMLVAGAALPYEATLAFLLFIIGCVFTLWFGVWRTGGLWKGGRDPATNTPVLYLPTVAGSFVSAIVVSALGFAGVGQMFFGAGVFAWLAIESVLLHRFLTSPETMQALRPTLGVQLAPGPVGSVAYLAVSGGSPDLFVHAMIGYGLLQALVLIRLAPWILEAGWSVGLWAFSFGATSLALSPLRLAASGDPAIGPVFAGVVFFAANALVIGLSIMTLWLLFSGRMYGRR